MNRILATRQIKSVLQHKTRFGLIRQNNLKINNQMLHNHALSVQ